MLEVCVDSVDGVQAAIAGGAGRVELCAALSEGGLTPSAGLMRAAAALPVRAFAMIRPRAGLFAFSTAEIALMRDDIATAGAAGLDGVVLGVQGTDGGLDVATLTRLIADAGPMGTTLHRVIDVVPDPLVAVRQALDLGMDRVLTSGGQPQASDGIDMIARMANLAGEGLSVMPGCGVTAANVRTFLAIDGIHEVHAACRRPCPGPPAFSDFDPAGGRSETDARAVAALVSEMGP